jgi:hypothetical protein
MPRRVLGDVLFGERQNELHWETVVKSRASQSVAEPDQYQRPGRAGAILTICSGSASSIFRLPHPRPQRQASVFKAQAATFTRYSSLPRLALAPLLEGGGPACLAARPLFPIGRARYNAPCTFHSMLIISSPSAMWRSGEL